MGALGLDEVGFVLQVGGVVLALYWRVECNGCDWKFLA